MRFFQRADQGLFASRTLVAHAVRGLVAVAAIAWAYRHQGEHPLLALAAGVGALVAMRGCPVCWTIGLVETSVQAWKRFAGR